VIVSPAWNDGTSVLVHICSLTSRITASLFIVATIFLMISAFNIIAVFAYHAGILLCNPPKINGLMFPVVASHPI
jgi:hypothetical protein